MNNTLKYTLLSLAFIAPLSTFAQATTTASTTATSTGATSTQILCMQNALDKRENALITGHDTYNTGVKAALTNRLTGLKASWGLADRKLRIEKRLATYKAFRTEMQAANTVLRNTKNSSWKNFQADAKVCGIKGTGESPTIISSSNISL